MHYRLTHLKASNIGKNVRPRSTNLSLSTLPLEVSVLGVHQVLEQGLQLTPEPLAVSLLQHFRRLHSDQTFEQLHL